VRVLDAAFELAARLGELMGSTRRG